MTASSKPNVCNRRHLAKTLRATAAVDRTENTAKTVTISPERDCESREWSVICVDSMASSVSFARRSENKTVLARKRAQIWT